MTAHLEQTRAVADEIGVGQPFLADHLEGDAAVEHLVPGAEHLPHAAFAKSFLDDVGAKEEIARAPLEEVVDLIRRQPAAL